MFVVHNMGPFFYGEDADDFSFCLNAGDRSSLTFERWMQLRRELDSNKDKFVAQVPARRALSHRGFRRARLSHAAGCARRSWLQETDRLPFESQAARTL